MNLNNCKAESIGHCSFDCDICIYESIIITKDNQKLTFSEFYNNVLSKEVKE